MADDEAKGDDRFEWFEPIVQAAFPGIKGPKFRKAWSDFEMRCVSVCVSCGGLGRGQYGVSTHHTGCLCAYCQPRSGLWCLCVRVFVCPAAVWASSGLGIVPLAATDMLPAFPPGTLSLTFATRPRPQPSRSTTR